MGSDLVADMSKQQQMQGSGDLIDLGSPASESKQSPTLIKQEKSAGDDGIDIMEFDDTSASFQNQDEK